MNSFPSHRITHVLLEKIGSLGSIALYLRQWPVIPEFFLRNTIKSVLSGNVSNYISLVDFILSYT